MTKRIRRRAKPRPLTPLQRVSVASEIMMGTPLKDIAASWRITRTRVHNIRDEYLEYRLVWRGTRTAIKLEGKRNDPS